MPRPHLSSLSRAVAADRVDMRVINTIICLFAMASLIAAVAGTLLR